MATRDKNYLSKVYTGLESSLNAHETALPPGFNKERFAQNCMAMMQDNQADFSKCDPQSVVRTLMKASYLGLDFYSHECYAIPYGSTCTFQTDYRGEVKLAKKYSSQPISDIYSKVVRKGDEFIEGVKDGKPYVDFSPISFNDNEIVGAFAVCLYQDGSMVYDTMSKAEIEHTRQVYSKAPNSKAWKDSYEEMAKKTVLRRLCKMIDLDFDNPQQRQAFEDGSLMDVKGKKAERYKAKDIYAEEAEPDETIEAEYTEVVEDAEEEVPTDN